MIHSPFAFLGGIPGGRGDREKVEKIFAERERLYQHNLQRLGDIDRLKEKNEILSEEVKMKEELIPGMEKMIAHIKKLTAENKDLKNKVDAIPELLEEERYKERANNERDMEDKDDELQAEIDELKEMIDDTKEFLKVCDRNKDGYYEHYETRQIATRFEGGSYQKEEETTDK